MFYPPLGYFSLVIYFSINLFRYKFCIVKYTYLSVQFNKFLLRFYLFISRYRGREGERERSINVWLHLTWSPTGDLVHHPGMCPNQELNRQPFGSQPCSTHRATPAKVNVISFDKLYIHVTTIKITIQNIFVTPNVHSCLLYNKLPPPSFPDIY